MAARASFPEIMQPMGLTYIDYATLLAPDLLEMHSNPPIKKSKFILDKKKEIHQSWVTIVQATRILSTAPLCWDKRNCPEKTG